MRLNSLNKVIIPILHWNYAATTVIEEEVVYLMTDLSPAVSEQSMVCYKSLFNV